LPVKQVLEGNLLGLVEEKWKAACSMVKPIFQHEFNLSVHFRIIRGIFLMEAGDLMHQFYTSLFQQVRTIASEYELCVFMIFNKCVQDILCIICLLQKPTHHHFVFHEFHIFRESFSVYPGISFDSILV
jgi:hypothetical protein